MDQVRLLRLNFDHASRMQFIDDCLELVEKSKCTFASQPGLEQFDLSLLAQEMSPLLKYESLNVAFVDQWGSASAPQKTRAHCLIAGVVVYERARQTLDWLDCYATFDEALTCDDLKSFPPLNVRRAVRPELYDRIVDRHHPMHVRYALRVSDRAFEEVKNCERYLRHVRL